MDRRRRTGSGQARVSPGARASLRPVSVPRLSRAEARRIAVRAQLLDAHRPTGLLEVVTHLTFLQLDPTAAIAPAADLVAWSRLGSAYRPAQLEQALERDRTLFEHNALVRPMSDVGLYLAGATDWPSRDGTRAWIRDNDSFRRDIRDRLAGSGPLTSRDIPDTSVVPWASTGWTNNRNVTQMLELLMMRGEVAIAGRVGRERLWDLAERVYPADVHVPSVDEARRTKNERRLRSLGIARVKSTSMPIEPVDVGDVGEPATVEGVVGEWRVDPEALDQDFEGRTALLSPFDRWSATGCGRRSCSTSSTRSRCTSRRKSAAGVTSRFPCCTRTGSSARWTRRPTGSVRCWRCTPSTRTSGSPAA